MKRLLLIGDVHFRAKKLADISAGWEFAVKWARENDVDTIVQAGDVFDHVNVYGREASTGTVYEAFLAPIADGKTRVVVVVGNHDMGSPSDMDALAPVDKYPFITVIRKPGLLELSSVHLLALPWINRAALVSKFVQKGETPKDAAMKVADGLAGLLQKFELSELKDKPVICVGHLEVTGASRGTHQPIQANGSFEYSPAQLASVGADAYALAHIHIRQKIPGLPRENDGYLGALCQLSFGECGNPDGFRVLGVEKNKIVEDFFVPNKASPRYHIAQDVDSAIALYNDSVPIASPTLGTQDYIKLRLVEKPANLPDGVIFEKLPDPAAAIARTSMLSADMPIDALLEKWYEVVKPAVTIEDLKKALLNIKMDEMESDAVGSLECIERICLRNITSHAMTDVDLSKMSGVCALEGPTGSGKTTFIEAIMLALYGFTPTRLYLPSVVASWDDEPAVIELDFRSSGRQYRVRRELKRTQKTFSHKAFLFELAKGQDPKAISGPKIDDVNKKCEDLVGSPEMVLCSVFSSQKDAEHLIELRPAERKELLAKMLSTNKYIIMAEQARKCVQAESAAISVWSPQADKLREELTALPADQDRLAGIMAQYRDAEAHVADAERHLSAAKVDVARVEAANLAHNEDVAKINAMEAEREALREKGRASKKRVDELLLLNSAEIEKAAEKLSALKSERETIRTKKAQQEKEAAQAIAEAERMRTGAAKAHLERVSAHAKFAGKIDDESRELDDIKRKKFESIMSEVSSAKVELSKAEQDEAQLQKKLALLAGFPDVDACKKCPLAIDGLDARKSLLGAQQRVIEAKEVVSAAEAKIEKLEAKVAEKRGVIDAKKVPLKDFMPEERDRIAEMEAEASRISKAKVVDSALATKLGGIDAEVKTIGDVESKLVEAKKASSEIERLRTQIETMREQFKKIEKDIGEIKVHDKVDDSEAKGRVLILAGELEAQRKKQTELAKEIGKAEAKVNEHEDRKTRLAEIDKLVETKQKTVSIMDVLAKALGRDGIPQLIFDCTIPQLQANMATLLSEFDDRWTIQVRSQRESKSSGNVQECVDIVVDDGNGERDISTYSGGEVKLLKSVIRIAFATLQAERSGRGVRVLILDEAMDKMDAEYSSMFIRMFNKLSKAFSQVFVVSHNDALVASLPNRIFFVRNSLASPVSVKTSFAGEA